MIRTGNDLLSALDSILAPYAVKHSSSKGRTHDEESHELRSPFQLDRDRIIHSKAFRRLKAKTQVLTPSSGDHFRDRLTHTLEVAQVSRSLARNLSLNEDLAEAIALAHDLGHTPFGHAGEDALNECMSEYGLKFEHNEQSKRIVEYLENTYPNHSGLNLTFETLEGLQKHSTPYDQAHNKFVSATIEAQVVNKADEIAYNNHDIDDGIRSGILKVEDLEKLAIWPDLNIDAQEYRMRYISEMMKSMLKDLVDQTIKNISTLHIRSLGDVYSCDKIIVEFSEPMQEKARELREFLYSKFYYSDEVRTQNEKQKQILKDLFLELVQNPGLMTSQEFTDEAEIAIIAKDYVSGMTDEFARIKHKEYAMS